MTIDDANPGLSPEAIQRTFEDFWRLWFGPELQRRHESGALREGFSLYIAQVLFPVKGDHVVYFNEEARGVGFIKARRQLNEGEAIYVSDLDKIEAFELPDELLDWGHATIIRSGEGWRIFFNFLSGRAKAKDMLELAYQFVDASEHSTLQGHAGPAVDNLFSAAELVTKAELILHRNRAVESKKHSFVASEINAWAKLGNIDTAFVSLFNRLSQQRPNARYGDSANRPPVPEKEDVELVKAMIDRGLRRIMKATERVKETD